jgi:hypothetical protein
MILVGPERGDEVLGMVTEGVPQGDELEEVAQEIFFLRGPDLLTAFVDDGVLVGVAVVGGGARRSGEEVREEFGFVEAGKREDGEDRSGRTWGRDAGDRGFCDRRREVFDGDVSEGNAFDYVLELAVRVFVLVLVGGGILELWACVSLLSGDVGKDVEEIGRGDSGVGEDGGGDERRGTVLVETRDGAVAIRAWIVPGIVRTVEKVLDDLGGGGEILLIYVIDL